MKKYIVLTMVTICVSTIGINQYIKAASTSPGSNGDPVVSKSYVDARINELKTFINNTGNNTGSNINTENNTGSNVNTGTTVIDNTSKQKIVEEVIAVIEALYSDKFKEESTEKVPVETPEAEDPAFLPVQLSSGQCLIGGEGAEIIFRSGNAIVYSENDMGVIDVSSGKELFNGEGISANHLLIVARKDGRGVRAIKESWFMVKGGYSIK